MNANNWNCRVLNEIIELEKFVDLEISVWGLNPRDAVPSSLLHAMSLNGSLVLGAYDGDNIVGLALAFPMPRGKKWGLWSHMAGVHPDYQGQGIGFALKQFQYDWALKHGYNTISWTFDPLQRGNAHFNLHLLGATAQIYHVNHYGDMTDGINAGLPSDRLEILWDLRHKHIKKLMQGQKLSAHPIQISDKVFLISADHDQPVLNLPCDLSDPTYVIEIPFDLAALKKTSPEYARAWRLALREALQAAFAKGYSATDFTDITGRWCYVLTAPQSWFLYVLECSDQTLYTGITPDLQRRIKQHNTGRGAAYTASRRPVKIIGAWRFASRSAALKAEFAFKAHTRLKKLSLLKKEQPYRDALFIPPGFDEFDASS